jgi:hypothetical protein
VLPRLEFDQAVCNKSDIKPVKEVRAAHRSCTLVGVPLEASPGHWWRLLTNVPVRLLTRGFGGTGRELATTEAATAARERTNAEERMV